MFQMFGTFHRVNFQKDGPHGGDRSPNISNGDIINFGTTSNSGCPSIVIVAEPSVPNGEVSNVPYDEVCSDYSEWRRWSLRYNSKLGLPLIRNHSRIFQMVVLLTLVQLQTRVTPHSLS